MSEWTSIVDDVVSYLRWKQESGVRSVDVSPETRQAMQKLVSPMSASAGRPSPATSGSPPIAHRPSPVAPFPRPPALPADASAERRQAVLKTVADQAAACTRCVLCQQRLRVVPGQGNPNQPDILFVGEAPGADEDEQGLAFVGRAGQLLTKMIEAMGYTRDQVFIANICKCRPPDNRQPSSDEMQACLPFLRVQIAAIRPKVIVALGAVAVKGLLESTVGITRLRGTWTTYDGIPTMPTYHPAYLLRLPPAKKEAWEDLKKVLQRLGKPQQAAMKSASHAQP